MTYDDDDNSGTNDSGPPTSNRNPFDRARTQQSNLSGFEQDEEDQVYEEPDRDTDYATAYIEEDIEDDYFEDTPSDHRNDSDEMMEPEDPQRFSAISGGSNPDPAEMWDDSAGGTAGDRASGNGDEEWLEDESYPEEEGQGSTLPMGLIFVAVVALLLLTAGGYGVMQQRSEAQEEILELRAALATAVGPEETTAIRNALQLLNDENDELATQVESLSLENRRLADTVAGLEAQLKVQQSVAAKKAASKPIAAAPKPAAPATTTAAKEPVAASSSESWFVNFGSYGQRGLADYWADKLRPTAGRVIVASSSKDGRAIYRVRVVELANRDAAENVARALEKQHGLSKLWVGKQ